MHFWIFLLYSFIFAYCKVRLTDNSEYSYSFYEPVQPIFMSIWDSLILSLPQL